MIHTFAFVDSALEELSCLINHPSLAVSLKPQIEAFEVDLRLLKMFLGCLIACDSVDKDVTIALDFDSKYMLSSIKCIWGKSGEGLYDAGLKATDKEDFKDWTMVASILEEKMQHCKQEINKYSAHLISCSLQCQSFPSDQMLEFLDEILNNLKHLNSLPVVSQTNILNEKLLLLRNLVEFATGRCPYGKDLTDFMIHVHTLANQAACLTCLYWVNEVEDDEEIGKRLNLYLTHLLQKVNPCTPEFTWMCFAVMKSTKSSRADTFLLGHFLSSFLDFLLQNLSVSLEDEFEILFEGLMFLISFLVDPPTNSVDDFALTLTRTEIDDVLHEASYLICFFDEKEKDIGRGRTILLDFGRKIHNLKVQIENLCIQIPHFHFPRINGLVFVEHLLENIENLTRTMKCNPKLVPFAKHQIFRIKKELMSLGQSIHVTWELLNEHKELNDLWTLMIHVAYQAELAVNSSYTIDHPIWYHLACLSNVLGLIKDVQNKFEKLKTNQIHGNAVAVPKLPSVYIPPVSGLDEIVVGFHYEENLLIDRITRGTSQFDIVPILGMGGLGKTTLARKLYNSPSVRGHFHVQAFCNVTPEFSSRSLLLEILNDLIVIDDEVRAMTKDDLAHQLYNCLKGRRYLIVMDDIWNVTAWEGVKGSLPDDNNGSRVVFTARNALVAPKAKPFHLSIRSHVESWELLQAKLFHKDPCPPYLLKVGMHILNKCRGLPLALVVVSGLLARIPPSLSLWYSIADDLNSADRFKLILELMYKHLPEALKPCLLYLGAFAEDKTIRAKRLMLMWAAEGFVTKSMSERNSNFLSVAKEYLNDLVYRGLVTVHSRSSTGGIKSCGVHDVIRDFCQAKSQEEQFFRISNRLSVPELYEQYRICVHSEWKSVFIAEEARGPIAHTLLYFPISDRTVYYRELFPYSNFKLLHLLDLQEVNIDDDGILNEVTTLVNLRYFALANERLIKVPKTIANLWNLETFVLQRNHLHKNFLPETIWKMKRLRHVDVGNNACVHLDSDVGKDSSELPNVESFSSVTIAHGKDGEELLRRLTSVRKLSCCFRNSHEHGHLPKLDRLTLLESLNVVSEGVGYPCVFSFPAALRKLSLSKFFIPWSEFTTLIAKLPCLEVLKLMSNAFEGDVWDMEEQEYPSLKYLELYGLDVADWIASVDSFPCLERLIVSYCHNLVKIPACFGEVPTMKVIEIHRSNHGAEVSAIEIQKEQLEMGNKSLEVQVTEIINASTFNVMPVKRRVYVC